MTVASLVGLTADSISLRSDTSVRSQSARADAVAPSVVPSNPILPQYYSPVVRVDTETHAAVLQYRNAETGDIVRQYPSEKQLEAYRKQEVEAETA